VDIPENWAEKRIVLLMEGVFHESELLVDGVRVASHSDGWTPIEVDLTDALDGKRGFELGVDANTPDDRDSGRFSQSLVAKQDWYGAQGGI
jgi:Glycosyl hydrolases family 2, sugar binding domain